MVSFREKVGIQVETVEIVNCDAELPWLGNRIGRQGRSVSVIQGGQQRFVLGEMSRRGAVSGILSRYYLMGKL